jgi:selenide,water dikinase
MEQNEQIRLTKYSHSAGCGCKIAPAVLQQILHTDETGRHDPRLLVGYRTNDDAAALDIDFGMVLIATNDFFMPIVDDPFQFGRIAAANAISDVYAMGGRPVLATAILGWPVEKLPASAARQVLEGARQACSEAGISLAGGHSIDALEPMFGLSVNGLCHKAHLKRNNTANDGDLIFLTKPIGIGVLATALKREVISAPHHELLIAQLSQLNRVGEQLGKIAGVTAMTDVTGFGLAGHLVEMAEGAGLSATLKYAHIPVIAGITEYLAARVVPDATYRNWNAYGSKITFGAGVDVMQAFNLLPDPQTNGGLLIAVHPDAAEEVIQVLRTSGIADQHLEPIGRFTESGEKVISVI